MAPLKHARTESSGLSAKTGGSEAAEHLGLPKTSSPCVKLGGDDSWLSELLSEVGWMNDTIPRLDTLLATENTFSHRARKAISL